MQVGPDYRLISSGSSMIDKNFLKEAVAKHRRTLKWNNE